MKKTVLNLLACVLSALVLFNCCVTTVYARPDFIEGDKDTQCVEQYYKRLRLMQQKQEEEEELRQKLVDYACSFAGVLPYVYGGNSLTTGTDCSGFVHLIYAEFGMDVPRTASEFQAMGNILEYELKPGDVIAYNNGEHVGIYIGDGQIVHAANPRSDTLIADMYCETPTAYVSLINIH